VVLSNDCREGTKICLERLLRTCPRNSELPTTGVPSEELSEQALVMLKAATRVRGKRARLFLIMVTMRSPKEF
jgi:hypothetical protein